MIEDLQNSIETTKDAHQLAKLKHVQACMLPESQYEKSAGFDRVVLEHDAGAALDLDDVDITTKFLGKSLGAPLMIAPMTGGVELAAMLNRRWATAAEHFGLAFGVGSQHVMLRNSDVRASFAVRAYAKSTLIVSNLGAAQICGDDGVDMAKRAVLDIGADALFLHLNPLQEACQDRGDTRFARVLDGIARVAHNLQREGVPVLVREVGFGLSKSAVKKLIDTGIAGLDCAGAGGTSWAKVEALCASDKKYRDLGKAFGEWGIPTVQSIANVRAVDKSIPLIATGGLRSGIDVAKALALGADLGAMAQPMLMAAMAGEDALMSFIEQTLRELRVAMFAMGAANIDVLKKFTATT